MTQTLTILRGLPGSGKTTWAEAYIREHASNAKCISRRALDAMIHPPYRVDSFMRSNPEHQFVLQARNTLLLWMLEQGYHVILDDYHLDEEELKEIKRLILPYAVEITYQDFRAVPLAVCIERDRMRPYGVGEETIRRMEYEMREHYMQEYYLDLPETVICNFDKISNNEKTVKTILSLLENVGHVTFLTGKYGEEQELSEWVKKYRPMDSRLLVPIGEIESETEAVKDLYDREILGKYNVRFVIDSRMKYVRLWRELGLTCFQVSENAG